MAIEIMSAYEIEKLIAIHVYKKEIVGSVCVLGGEEYGTEVINGQEHYKPWIPYSRNLLKAWELVQLFDRWYSYSKKRESNQMTWTFANDLSDGQVVTFSLIVHDGFKRKTFSAEGVTLERAICLAVLESKGVHVESDVIEIEKEKAGDQNETN